MSIDHLVRTPSLDSVRTIDAPADRLWVRIVAGLSMVVLGMKIELPQSIEAGWVVAALLAPVWLGALKRYRGAWVVVTAACGTLAAGLVLHAMTTSSSVRETNALGFTANIVLVVGIILSLGLVLWSRSILGSTRVALWFGVGIALSISPTATLFASNPWKFGVSLPITLIALALARQTRRWWAEIVVLLALTGISAFSDFRSAFGLLLLAAVLTVAQLPFLRRGHRGSSFLVFLGIVAVVVIVYVVGTYLILNGYLGADTQARSEAQIASSGNLIVGGRPELAATLALMAAKAGGFGFGIAPSPTDVAVAKTGMSAVGYDPNNGYVENFMFGGHFELHSVFGDIWVQAGIMGLVFVAAIVIVLVAGITRQVTDGRASGVVLFVVTSSLWNLLFSPLLTSERLLVLAIGLALVSTASAHRRRNSTTSSTGPVHVRTVLKPAASRSLVSARSAPRG
jgi:hypothetical protein